MTRRAIDSQTVLHFIGQMLERSASEQISSATQRLYQDLPVAKVLGNGLKPESAFVSSTESLTKVVTNIAKIGALASLPIGIFLLNSYLRDEGAPLPAADSSISVLFSMVCVIFLLMTVILASIFLLPTIPKMSGNFAIQTATSSFDRKKFTQIAAEYWMRFGPFLSYTSFFFFEVGLIENHFWRWVGPISCLVTLAVYCRFWYVHRYGKVDDVLLGSAHSLIAFTFLAVVIIGAIVQVEPHMNTWAVAFICVLIPLAAQVLMVTLVTNWKRALAAYLLILIVLSGIWPGLGFLGGLTLRYVGIGGGIPVSIRVRTYGRTGTVSGVEEISGCLVLMTGGDVLIRPTPRILDCQLRPQFEHGQSLTSIATYSRVERYARVDVVRVSKFADAR
jgi:hypothetical protein